MSSETNSRMRILVVGAGAVGGYFGGRLFQAGRDVTFLLREHRAAAIRRDGLRLVSPHGDATLRPPIVSAQALQAVAADPTGSATSLVAEELRAAATPFDLILVSTKSYALPQAMEDFAPAVGANTLILPLLNGMAHLDLLDRRFGAEHVLGGSVRIIADILPDGAVEQQTRLGELTFGFRHAAQAASPHAADLADTLTVPSIDLVHSPDVIGAMWQKWWLLAAMGTACVLAGGSLGQARSTPHGDAFNTAVLDECMAVATRNGYPPRADWVAEMRDRFGDPACPLTSSMFRDMTRDREVEADQILGDFLERAQGTPLPLVLAAFTRLKVYEAQRSA